MQLDPTGSTEASMRHSAVKQPCNSIAPLILLTALTLPSSSAPAGQVALAWDASASTSVTGYMVYMGRQPGRYDATFNAGNATTLKVTNLADGATYYFAATAYDGSGHQSPSSKELAVTLPATTLPPPATPVPTAPTVPKTITADFTVTKTTGTAPLAVTFRSASTGTIARYSWSFGDGTTSTALNPRHRYRVAGTYSVSLRVIAPDGSQAGTTKANLITVKPRP